MIIFSDKLFTKPIKIIQAFNQDELIQAFSQIEKLKKEFFILGYIRYETFTVQKSNFALLYFEVF